MEINEKTPELAIKAVPIKYPFTPQEMYKIPRFVKDFWALPQYKTPKHYLESHNNFFHPKVEKPKNLFEKPVVQQPSHTYLNDIISARKNSPSPNEYQKVRMWFTPPKKLKELRKIPRRVVEIPPKNSPGVGEYNVLESEANMRKKLESFRKREEVIRKTPSEKVHLLNDEIYLAAQSPGPGSYFRTTGATFSFPAKKAKRSLSPDQIAHKIKQKQIKKEFIRSKSPDNREYSPLPLNFFTFERFKKDILDDKSKGKIHKKKEEKPQFLFIGGDKRFRYPEEKKGFDPGPGPDAYKIDVKWPQKEKAVKNSAKNGKKEKENEKESL